MQTAEIADWFQYLVCVRWAFVTLWPPGTNAKFVLRFDVFLCCASLFSYYCPVLLLNGSLSCWQLVTRVKLSFTLTSLHCWLLPCSQQASPPESLLLDMFICMMNTQFFGHSWLHLVFLVRDDLDVENRMTKKSCKSSCSSVHKEEQDSPLSWWGCSLRKFILYCLQHNFILLPLVMYFLVT